MMTKQCGMNASVQLFCMLINMLILDRIIRVEVYHLSKWTEAPLSQPKQPLDHNTLERVIYISLTFILMFHRRLKVSFTVICYSAFVNYLYTLKGAEWWWVEATTRHRM